MLLCYVFIPSLSGKHTKHTKMSFSTNSSFNFNVHFHSGVNSTDLSLCLHLTGCGMTTGQWPLSHTYTEHINQHGCPPLFVTQPQQNSYHIPYGFRPPGLPAEIEIRSRTAQAACRANALLRKPHHTTFLSCSPNSPKPTNTFSHFQIHKP